ncbi:MAG: hypothetical protein R3A80_07920 [Bdellovibrionota bacterium]
MKRKFIKIFPLAFSILFLSNLHAESFSERFRAFAPTPEKIFYAPITEQEQAYYQIGKLNSWKRYSKKLNPNDSTYDGYILFSDPYHLGHKKISFLMGADCSNFTHRLFQVMGADYPFAKTRYFLAIANQSEKPQGLSECMWDKLKKSFQKIELNKLEVGDITVYGTTRDEFGERGHMGIVSSLNPFAVLQAKYKKGFITEEINKEEFVQLNKPSFFRYIGNLRDIETTNLNNALELNYPQNNSGCDFISP